MIKALLSLPASPGRGIMLAQPLQSLRSFLDRPLQGRAQCGRASPQGTLPRHSQGLQQQAAACSSSSGVPEKQATPKPKQNAHFCRMCGAPLELLIPPGDSEWRHVCSSGSSCGYIDYQNPKLVVGCIVEHEGKILLCKRGIQPCKGLWTLPAGFLEIGESTAEGARRETLEEAEAAVQVLAPFFFADIPFIGQAYYIFRAALLPPFTAQPGPESLDVRWVAPADIPFSEIAFSSISMALRLYCEDLGAGSFRMHHAVVHKQPGSAPNDPANMLLKDHIAVPALNTRFDAGPEAP